MLTSFVLQMAIIWYITEKTRSAAVLSAAALIAFLSQAALCMFTGVFIDRFSRKTVLMAADLFIAAFSLVLFIAGLFAQIPIALLLTLAGMRSVGTAFHYPALQAATPLIVPKEHLTKYAGYAKGFESVSSIASPGIAAVLFMVMPLHFIALFDVFGALVGVAMLAFLDLPPVKAKQRHDGAHMLREVKEGFTAIRREPGMIALMAIGALYGFIYFPVGTYYPLITMTYFGGNIAASGVVETVFSLGMLGGSLLLGLWGEKLSRRRALISSVSVFGTCVLVTGLLPPSGLPVFVLLSGLMGISAPFYFGVETAIYQIKFHKGYLGRVFSLSSGISMATMSIGLVVSGVCAQWLGVERWFFVLGALALLLVLTAFSMPSLKCWDTAGLHLSLEQTFDDIQPRCKGADGASDIGHDNNQQHLEETVFEEVSEREDIPGDVVDVLDGRFPDRRFDKAGDPPAGDQRIQGGKRCRDKGSQDA